MMELSVLKSWLWDAACAIRGPVDAPKFKGYILLLVLLERLSDVFNDEGEHLTQKLDRQVSDLVEQDHGLARFFIPPQVRWEAIRTRSQTGLGQYLTDAVTLGPVQTGGET
ncbi:MAG: type I restriction-modification system subunit M N-terminal domain-containing protein [Anaerolineae bacterium]